MKFPALAILLVVPGWACAGTIYKCVDPAGKVSYQEQQCPKTASQTRKGYVAPVAPAKQSSWAAQSSRLSQQERQRQALYEKEAPHRTYPVTEAAPEQLAAEASSKVRAERQTQKSNLGTTRLDQYGKPYTQVGQDVVIDQRTGKPCILNGNNEIIFCH